MSAIEKCPVCGKEQVLWEVSGLCDTCNIAYEMGLDTNPLYRRTAWVTEDGSYGQCDVVLFTPSLLEEDEWCELSELSDNDRITYVTDLLKDRVNG